MSAVIWLLALVLAVFFLNNATGGNLVGLVTGQTNSTNPSVQSVQSGVNNVSTVVSQPVNVPLWILILLGVIIVGRFL